MTEPATTPETFDFGENLGYEHRIGGAVSDGPKIEYQLLNGFTSDAYLDDEIPEGREVMTGVDKHTDERITVRWTGERWVQLS